MAHYWYLIDDNGCRRITVSDDNWDFWTDLESSGDQPGWSGFTQLVVRRPPMQVVGAVRDFARDFGLACVEVTDDPDRWDGALCLARAGDFTLVTEPGLDLEDRYIAPLVAEELSANLEADAAFFGHDPAADTLMLTVYIDGAPKFEWRDSLVPGPSRALSFHADGTATHEDPRRFALRRMGMAVTSPFLDRYAFLEYELQRLGLERVAPALDHLPIEAAFCVSGRSEEETGS